MLGHPIRLGRVVALFSEPLVAYLFDALCAKAHAVVCLDAGRAQEPTPRFTAGIVNASEVAPLVAGCVYWFTDQPALTPNGFCILRDKTFDSSHNGLSFLVLPVILWCQRHKRMIGSERYFLIDTPAELWQAFIVSRVNAFSAT